MGIRRNFAVFAQGTLTRLRPLRQADLPTVTQWNQDPEMIRLMGSDAGLSPGNRCRAVAIETAGGRLIGEVALQQINWRRREAELRICIGEKAYWGAGYASDALNSFLHLAFIDWRMEKIYLRVYSHNRRAVGLYRRWGFLAEGILAAGGRRPEAAPIILMALQREAFLGSSIQADRPGFVI